MFTKFWDKLAEELAGRWTAEALGPALAFWGGGLLAWAHRNSWDALVEWLEGLNNTAVYIALAVGALALLLASSEVVRWMQSGVLRLVEGYWPGILRRVPLWWSEHRVAPRLHQKKERWQELARIDPRTRSALQQEEYARVDVEVAHHPVDKRWLMPSAVGNILRAAEEYPYLRYGLTTSVAWPRLWLGMPKAARETLGQARETLNSATRLLIWSGLFIVWVVWAWWAVIPAVVGVLMAYWRMRAAAGAYGDLLRAAFDLYRFKLYEALRWPTPQRPYAEEAYGAELTKYLFRGLVGEEIRFVEPE
jgi:hypothetical protein